MANAAIGRAMGLIIKNIGGIRKGIEDMGSLGNPGKYTMVVGEAEERSPWQPLHVDYGFKKEDSTVTLTFPQSFQQMLPFSTDAKGILATVAGSIVPSRFGLFTLVLTPNNAQSLAKEGWSKQAVKEYIIKNTRVHEDYYQRLGLDNPKTEQNAFLAVGGGSEIFHRSKISPDPVYICVYGGFGSWMGFLQGGSSPITKKVDLPKNWVQLVNKYKNVVPNYVRY